VCVCVRACVSACGRVGGCECCVSACEYVDVSMLELWALRVGLHRLAWLSLADSDKAFPVF
jgi:hypothetical protein